MKPPEQTRATQRVYEALQRGELVRLPCVLCSDPKTEAHHDDYSKPLEVIWVCHKCHMGLHKASRPRRQKPPRERMKHKQLKAGFLDDPVLHRAIEAAGGSRTLAKKLGISHQAMWQWRQCPVMRVLDVERLSGVPRTLLRPDIYPPHERRQRA